MKKTIKILLREEIQGFMLRVLQKEGARCFPKLIYTENPEPMFYPNGENGQAYNEKEFKTLLAEAKIDKVIIWLKSLNRITKLESSKSTLSKYITLKNGKKIRLSDHKTKKWTDGIDIVVTWDSHQQEIVDTFDELFNGDNPKIKSPVQVEPVLLSAEKLAHARVVEKEGLKYFPYLKFKRTILGGGKKTHLRFFKTGNDKGSYSIEGFKKLLASTKINFIVEHLKSWGKVKNLVYSNTTNSVYFTYVPNGQPIRLSDHAKSTFEGLDILVLWDTNINEIVDKFKELK